ncbi:cytochrome P450 76T24-like [Lotus japonicus]|uniref:cytochrome P450 76T24-like n=1 Tax=Lotus japonicus TaxID=34305 RepID=UPI002583CECD|nr:cytochrome P450 76T24-like [Lotus japonicus]
MDLLLIVLVSASTLTFFIFRCLYNQTKSSSNLPPGPRPLPIIGNILELGRNPPIALSKLSKIYGPIMTLKLGSITTIVISSPQLAKQVLQENSQAFSSRITPHAVQIYDHHKFAITWLPPTAQWRNQRRACATKIFSPKMLDSTKVVRQQKLQELLDYVKDKSLKCEVLSLGEAVFTPVLNSFSNTFFSLDLSHSASDEKSQEFKNIITGAMEDAGRPNVVDFFPILGPLDPQGFHARMSISFIKLRKIIDAIIEERMCSRVSKTDSGFEVANDVLDSLLSNVGGSSQLSREEMLHLFMDLFIAGIDTTVVTVEWAMSELLRNPDKLEKTKDELRQAIGEDATLVESHILKLPYLQAVVKETLRLHPPAPFLVPRKCDEDVSISGFLVPKDAQILVNLWAMGRDPIIWENPNMFVPERFLDCKIDFKGHNFELIPFGAGKRMCPGLPLAYRSVHLLLASFLHYFDWKLADGLTPEHINMEERFAGLSLKKAQALRVQAISIKQ